MKEKKESDHCSWRIKKVLLVNPPLSNKERFGSMAALCFTMPPLGLAILVAVLNKRGFDAQILDCEALHLGEKEALIEIMHHAPDVIGFTSTTLAIHNAVAVAKRLKHECEIPIVIGGVHVTSLPEDTMERFPCFDYGVYGEGEITFPELLSSINNKTDLADVQGILYRDNGRIKKNEPRPYIKNLDVIPYPAYDSLSNLTTNYCPPFFMFKRLPSMSIITSRGCPGQCTFCNHSLFGNRFRMHSAEYVIEMIEELIIRYGIKDIQIYDDTFVVNRARLMKICQIIIDKKLDITWSANARVDYVDLEMLKLMKKAGCWLISYGIESGDPMILKVIKKGITLEQIEQVIAWTREARIISKGFLIFGSVAENHKSIERTFKFILHQPLDLITTTYFTPLPGSEDYKYAEERGSFLNDWRKLSAYSIVFVPHGLTENEIKEARFHLMCKFYIRPKIFVWFIAHLMKSSYYLLKMRIMKRE